MNGTGAGTKVVGIGQCCWDYLVEVDAYPTVDTKTEIGGWHEQGGGPVATALVTLEKLGAPCRFHGVTGGDLLGSRIRASLEEAGIDIAGLAAREGGASQVAFIVVERRTGRRTVLWQRPTGDELRPEELGNGFLDRCSFLLLDGLMAEVSLHAAREARKRGIPILLDAGRIRPGMLQLAQLCDYVIAAEQFAIDLGWPMEPEGFGKAAREIGAPVVTVTRGERGNITCCGSDVFQVPGFSVETVDTTGAGDVFHGAFAFGILQKWDLRKAIRFASAVAALKCTKPGGRAGIPTLQEAMTFLRERP